MGQELVTSTEAAELVGVPRATFYRQAKQLNIPKITRGGKTLYEAEVLERYFPKKSQGVATVISFCNQKGGVGKTTTTLNVALALHEQGKRVLAIDLDPQANLTVQFTAGRADDLDYMVAHALGLRNHGFENIPIEKVLIKTDTIDILPSNIKLANFDTSRGPSDYEKVKKLVTPLRGLYDFICIDCGPTLDVKLLNALVASDIAIIPTKPEKFSIQGLQDLKNTIEEVRESNPSLKAFAMVNEYEEHKQLSAVVELISEYFPLMDYRVPRATDISKVQMAPGKHLSQFSPKKFRHYLSVADEVCSYV